MIRGTTANFRFKLPYIVQQVKTATINFWQKNNSGTLDAPLPIIKNLKSCTTTDDPYELSVTLSPHETARFSATLKGNVQLDAVTIEGVKFGCKPQLFNVYPNKNPLPGIPDDPLPGGDGIIIFDGGTIAG